MKTNVNVNIKMLLTNTDKGEMTNKYLTYTLHIYIIIQYFFTLTC
jgi:hypothetical protein